MKPPILTVMCVLAVCAGAPAVGAAESTEQRDRRMAWWREARFGMFIHWGLYAIPAGEYGGKMLAKGKTGEWIMNDLQIPIAEYEKLATRFNPIRFNARQWVDIAKGAGMKYIVITSKHHDGFCLWDSKLTPYDVIDATPFGRDILKELAEACREEGIVLCFYYSIMDWHHPDAQAPHYPTYNTSEKSNPGFARYVEQHLKPQIRELLTQYGRIGVMWFDGEWIPEWTESMGKDLEAYCRSIQPDLIVNNRVGKGRRGMQGMSRRKDSAGDFGTPEQEIPPAGFPGVDWESCMTMNDTWGYRKDDPNWKSADTMIRMLVDAASKGGNLLMNVGPTAEGEIPVASVERLAQVGQWMSANRESIHGTQASPFRRSPWGRATQKQGKIYLHVLDWPGSGLLVVPIRNKIVGAHVLGATPRPVGVANDKQTIAQLQIGSMPPRPAPGVVAVEIDGEPRTDTQVALVQQGADDSIELVPEDVEIEGTKARVEKKGDNPLNIGYWTDVKDIAAWRLEVGKAGRYEVEVEYSLDPKSAGSEFRIEFGADHLLVKPAITRSWIDFTRSNIGAIDLQPGTLSVIVRPTNKPGQAVLDLRAIRLRLLK